MAIEVSVIIPNYNCKQYLAKAIASVVKQADINLEILVIDDGSTDGSVQWIEIAKQTFPQIRLLEQPNTGVVLARNRAIEEAQGKYIAFLDADDYWVDNKLKDQLDYMKANSQCSLTFTNYMHVDEEYTPIIDCFSFWPEFQTLVDTESTQFQTLDNALSVLLFANVIGTSSVMVKRSAIRAVGAFDKSLKSASDWDCWLKLAKIGEVGFTTQIGMDYLMRQNSITANRENRLNAMQEILSRSSINTSLNTKRKAKARMLECYAEYYRELGLKFKAFVRAVAAFTLFPHRRNLRHLLFDIKNLFSFG